MSLIIKIDPLNKYKKTHSELVRNFIGHILPWAIACPKGVSLKEFIDRCYGYHAGWHQDSTGIMEDDGTMKYPEDPVMYPIAVFEKDGEKFFSYPYGLVGAIIDGERHWGRMD